MIALPTSKIQIQRISHFPKLSLTGFPLDGNLLCLVIFRVELIRKAKENPLRAHNSAHRRGPNLFRFVAPMCMGST